MRMHRRGQCKCLNCHEFYVPDVRNKSRQQYCQKPQCRQASKRASQRRWCDKPENREHFSGTWNSERVRAWRKANPGYWRRSRSGEPTELQETLDLQVSEGEKEVRQDGEVALQDLLQSQDPLVLGLVIQLTDLALQEDIVGVAQRLITKGRAMMGGRPGGPDYDKKTCVGGSSAAGAVAV